MSSPPNGIGLSRAVSEIDLNMALNEVKAIRDHAAGDTGMRYTKETLFALRPKQNKNEEHVEVQEIKSLDGEGLMTPPNTYPSPPPPTPVSPFNGIPAPGTNVTENTIATVATSVEPKKKKQSKSKSKKSPMTGFEEFYADPPITPDEHEEECDIYDETRPFADRIEVCIQRYRARRKLDEVRSNILTKYFMLGGVEATNKAFTGGGLNQETLDNATAEEIAAINATDYVRANKRDKNAKYYDGSEDWVVDFEGVAKGFFSHRVTRVFPIDTEKDLATIANVIRNFLNYVLQHAACPEYTEDVMAARRICELAEKELWAIKQVTCRLPGDFNIAASTLYGGRYQGLHMGGAGWAVEDPAYKSYLDNDQGFSDEEAERIFKTAIAFAGNDELFMRTMNANVHIVKSETRHFEVAAIERASLRSIAEVSAAKDHRGEEGYIKALGTIKFKAWEGPGFDDEDITEEEAEAVKLEANNSDNLEAFWVEDEVLQFCFVGMKIELVTQELNIGIKFCDTVLGVYCSFHTVLPNEKMTHWKEPVPNTRPAPTVDDPEVEETVMNAIMEGDMKDDERESEGKK